MVNGSPAAPLGAATMTSMFVTGGVATRAVRSFGLVSLEAGAVAAITAPSYAQPGG
jgi:hypothetical protein